MAVNAPRPSIDTADFRRAMGRWATGVAVLTSRLGGHDLGMTANSLTSVSLDPMLVLVCLENDSRFQEVVVEAGVWGVSILAAEQRAAASWFATRGRPAAEQMAQFAHHRGEATGVVLLEGALAHLECRNHAVLPAGDHTILVGEVVSAALPDVIGPALTYYRGGYGRLD